MRRSNQEFKSPLPEQATGSMLHKIGVEHLLHPLYQGLPRCASGSLATRAGGGLIDIDGDGVGLPNVGLGHMIMYANDIRVGMRDLVVLIGDMLFAFADQVGEGEEGFEGFSAVLANNVFAVGCVAADGICGAEVESGEGYKKL